MFDYFRGEEIISLIRSFMGRETYTFKLNAEKLSTTLADTLQNEFNVEQQSFFEYVFKENEQLAKYNWRYLGLHQPVLAGEIISTFRNEPLTASVLYLGLAMSWLRASDLLEYSSDDGFESAFAYYGFELIYDLGQKDKCWVYLNQLYIYCDMNGSEERTDSYDGCYYHWENDMYKDALDYLVVLMSKLCLDENIKIATDTIIPKN